jgi:anion-transporting  ArsA/GET3 family ATPase
VEATRRRSGGRLYYDAVVMDAPPTGRIGNFLNVATEISGLAKVGPIRGHADTVQSVIKSPQTAVHFVTVLEEMPVQETLDGVAELRGLAQGGLQLGGIMINMVRPVDLAEEQLQAAADGTLDQHELDTGLKAAGIEDRRGLAASLAAELTEHAREELAQRAQRARVAEAGQPCYDLPLITDQMDLAGLYRLAAALREQGAA